ncbi:hypothetical protein LSH36_383g01009 [Paralvinella palmiformis]|uniref:Uncharacterized protein n=1 Tax=Paralvinella palmiformis TaxID=53620 RepID=A0AAD9JD52_9ANNE|nr:hypothetical protein LSH36_383g01009 [Paralvinella palmiformis]
MMKTQNLGYKQSTLTRCLVLVMLMTCLAFYFTNELLPLANKSHWSVRPPTIRLNKTEDTANNNTDPYVTEMANENDLLNLLKKILLNFCNKNHLPRRCQTASASRLSIGGRETTLCASADVASRVHPNASKMIMFGKESGSADTKDFVKVSGCPAPCYSVLRCRECLLQTKRVIYNRVHKCGTTTSQILTMKLAKIHNFRWVKKWNRICMNHYWCESEEEENTLVKYIMNMPTPYFIIRHAHYIDFNRYSADHNLSKPVLINVIRDPLEQLNSFHYYLRFENAFRRPWVTPKVKAMSFTSCVLSDDPYCVSPAGFFWMIPFFCGRQPWCRQPSRRALNQAVYNVVNNYALVGVLEQIKDFYWVLGELMPQFFGGILAIYNDFNMHASGFNPYAFNFATNKRYDRQSKAFERSVGKALLIQPSSILDLHLSINLSSKFLNPERNGDSNGFIKLYI